MQNKVLDGIRGFALLLVILSHSSHYGIKLFGLNFSGTGRYGVFIFFVLSAYLLSSYFNALHIISKKDIALYFKRRLLRIYPLFLIFVLVYAFLSSHGISYVAINAADIIPLIFLVKAQPLFWTIVVEFQFYLLLPILIFGLSKLPSFKIKCLVTQSIAILAYVFVKPAYSGNVLPFMQFFLAGTALSFFCFAVKCGELRTPNKNIALWLVLISLTGFIVTVPAIYSIALQTPISFKHFHLDFGLFTLLSSTLIGALLFSRSSLFFCSRFFILLGKISYTAYLMHLIILYFVVEYMGAGTISFLVFFLLTTVFSYLIIRCVERPFYTLAHRAVV
jgi:peptidoglycan/LPS O-acetylase OafA/YrhL